MVSTKSNKANKNRKMPLLELELARQDLALEKEGWRKNTAESHEGRNGTEIVRARRGEELF